MTNKPQFVGEKVKLGAIVRASSERNKGGRCDLVYSVTNSQGFIPSEEYFSKEVFSKDLNTYRIVKRDMIAYNPSRINVGSVALQDKNDEVVVSPLYVVFSVDESKVAPGYVVRFLKSKPGLDQIAFQSIGTVRNNLKYKALCQMELTLPSLSVQRDRLANFVSIESQISQSRKAIEQLDQLVKSRFVEMFQNGDHVMRSMGDLVENIVAGTNIGGQQRPLEEGEYGVLKISAVTKGVFDPREFKVVDDVSHIKMIHPRKGDLLFSRANTSEMVGATAIVDKDYEDLFLPDKLWRLDPADGVETIFLKALLSSPAIRAEVSKVSTGSSGSMQNISMAKFRKLPAFLPPLTLQQEFAAFVQQVDKSRFAGQLSALRLTRYG